MRPTRSDESNVAVAWAHAVVDALVGAGLTDVFVSPGSRSTPLVAAVVDDPRLRDHCVVDERSAAFCALGAAQASARPVALICTSGTAGANYHPAVCEASHAGVPLLVMTADRPPHLRESGSSQSMRQVGLYGDHVRWSHDVALPSSDPAKLRYVRSIARRAFAIARDEAGPVHLNFPFEKPLEPSIPHTVASGPGLSWHASTGPIYQPSVRTPDPHAMTEVVRRLESASRPIIVVGSTHDADEWGRVLDEIARRIGAPIIAEATSQLRFGPHASNIVPGDVILSNATLAGTLRPDLVLQLGRPPIDWPLIRWMDGLDAARIVVSQRHDCDPNANAEMIFVGNEGAFLDALRRRLPDSAAPSEWRRKFDDLGQRASEYLCRRFETAPLVDATVAHQMARSLPAGAALVVSSSMPLREFEAFAVPRSERLTVYCNRGLNGIDGVLSTAAGVASAHDGPTALLIGDVALAHDIGALQLRADLTVVVVDNGGGAIFDHLPVAGIEPMYSRHFTTAPNLNWAGAAALFDVTVAEVTTQQELARALGDIAEGEGLRLLVVRTDRAEAKTFRDQTLTGFDPETADG